MLVRLIIWGIIGFLIYTAYQAIRQALMKPPPEKTARGEEMVRDPECGTYVPRSDAIKTQIRSKTYYFCSEACRDKYREHS
jgi:uncharacterized protein